MSSESPPPDLASRLRQALRSSAASVEQRIQRIGHYRIDHELGSGGMATVYAATDEELRRPVAIKLMREGLQFSAEARSRFQREALAAARIDHPCICPVYEVGDFGGVPFIVMRRISGRSLAELVESAKSSSEPGNLLAHGTTRSVTSVLSLFEDIARALHCAHEAGLVHRDIKPANLMIADDGKPVVLDFGIARDQQDQDHALTATGQILGTPLYMSPEQIVDWRSVDRRTDVYSLALTLYEALTLEQPFAAPTQHSIQDKILNFTPPDPRRRNRRIGNDLAMVLWTGLEKKSMRRYATCADFADDLRRIIEGRQVSVSRPSLAVRGLRWADRNRMATALILTLASSSIGMLGLWRISNRNQERFELTATRLRADAAHEKQLLLYPSTPDVAPRLRAWIEEQAEPLAVQLPRVRQASNELAPDRSDETSVFLRNSLADTIEAIESVLTHDLPDVRRRLAWAERVHHETIGKHAERWATEIEAIRASKHYIDLALSPQLGLVPLGPDPRSGLQEFAVAETGAIPNRKPDGALEIDANTSIVLVLLPGGRCELGNDHGAPVEAPAFTVELEPFFLGKCEVTQAQWTRITGSNPSSIRVGRPYRAKGPLRGQHVFEVTEMHPVESVSSSDALVWLRRVGLDLPTEAQWEYAARAGTGSPWPFGRNSTLEGLANMCDESTLDYEGPKATDDWNDHFPAHAPVGYFAANQLGLHDMFGNVEEWCRDWRATYTDPLVGGDGRGEGLREVVPEEQTARPRRGGSWATTWRSTGRASFRGFAKPDDSGDRVGIRVARRLDR